MTVGTEIGILCRESRLGLGCFSSTLDHAMTFPNHCDNVLFFEFLFGFIFSIFSWLCFSCVFIYMYVSSYYVIIVLSFSL